MTTYISHKKTLTLILLSTTILNSAAIHAAPIFQEDFEDTNFESRGWFDSTDAIITTSEHITGSTAAAQFTYNQGDTSPIYGSTMRRSFAETDEIYVSYYVKYSSNWVGSDQPFHPHEFYLLTNLDDPYNGLSGTHMTAYIEQNEGIPLIAIQDSQNINLAYLNVDITATNENRAAAGCNGLAGAAAGLYEDCYAYGSGYRNVLEWRASQVYFSDTPGPRYKNDWHRVEAYLKMNTITNGVGNYNGVIQYYYDGQLLINYNTVLFRTGQNPNMRFDTFIIAPYIGTGSPITQTMWVDNLVVATKPPIRPLPPTNFTVQ
jgi:hypothetical protein